MSWTVSWSWQAPSRISALAAIDGHLAVAYGLDLVLFNESNEIQWKQTMPFKVHAICESLDRLMFNFSSNCLSEGEMFRCWATETTIVSE